MMGASWKSELLGSVVTLQRGYDLPYRLRKPGSVPIVTSSGIEDTHCEAMVTGPGVVTGRYGTIGKVFFVPGDFWPHNTTLYVSNFHGNDPLFISYLLKTVDFHSHSGKTGVPGINRNDLHAIEVCLPHSKAEQQEIAQALSDADTLTESLEPLIAKKRHLRQGAIQELLTGQKRLPGFDVKSTYKQTELGLIPRDWNLMPMIRAVGAYIDYRGRTPKKLGLSWGGGDILALSANNVKMGSINLDQEAHFGSEELYRKWMVQGECERGDVLLTMEAPLGNVAQVPDSKKYILSQRVLLIKPKDWLLKDFLAHYMKGPLFQKQLHLNSTGSTAKGIQRRKLDEVPIGIPPTKAEQEAIASILSDIDAEIASLEAKLGKVRHLKQGMIQELLTGRKRLV